MNKIEDFYRSWQENLPGLARGYIYDDDKKLLPNRLIFSDFKDYLERFLKEELDESEKIIILPGIRGVGKSTLLLQLFSIEKFLRKEDNELLLNLRKLEERFYLDVGKLKLEEIKLNDFFKFFEKIKDFSFESGNKKMLLLLDEIHYDENWGLFLKNIFDRTKGHKNILIIATGSSAINLRMSSDLFRRSTVEEIYPLKFNEYLKLKYAKNIDKNLGDDLKKIIINSGSAKEVYSGLAEKDLEIGRIFSSIPMGAPDDFFSFGNFPFTLAIENKIKILELLKNVINGIILKDVITLKKFKSQTTDKIGALLYLLAHSDVISYEKLREALRIERFETLDSLIEVLIISGILVKVKSLGRTYGGARKTPKLLFVAPSLRSAVLDNNFLTGVEGKKLEDYFALIYMNDLRNKLAIDLAYDAAQNGADFVLTLKDRRKITIEAGFNKENIKQIQNTQKKAKGKYGIIFGSENLELVGDTIVKIPLKYLLLV